MLAAAGHRVAAAAEPLDPACAAGAVARYRALEGLREFRQRLYGCLTARADALFELADAVLTTDHAVTSLAELSLEAAFRRGHGALYDALAAGRIDGERLGTLLARTVPQLVDGPEAAAWAGEHDRTDDVLLDRALAGLPAREAGAVRDACALWRRQRFAVDGTCYPRPGAECSPGRGYVHRACSCDGDSNTVPGWEFQFVAAVGRLRTGWAGLVDVAHVTRKDRTRQAAAQVRAVLRRLCPGRDGLPLFLFDAGYSAAGLTWELRGQPAHVLVRLAFGSVLCQDQLTWPGKPGRPGDHGAEVHCLEPADFAAAEQGKGPRGREKPLPPNPEPDEELILPATPAYGTIRAEACTACTPASTTAPATSRAGAASCPSCAAPSSTSPSATSPTAASPPAAPGCGTPAPAPCPWPSSPVPTPPGSTSSMPSGSRNSSSASPAPGSAPPSRPAAGSGS